MVNTNTGATTGGTTQNHTINLPASIVSGRILIAIVSFSLDDGTFTATWPAGWTAIPTIFSQFVGPGAYNAKVEGRYRVADGSEGATMTITTTPFECSAHATYQISGQHASQFPEAGVTQDSTGADEFQDPPSLSPTGGSKDYLWIAVLAYSRGRTVSAYPTNYTGGFQNLTTASRNAGIGTAVRALTAASEDPGTFTMSALSGAITATVAVHPAAVAGGVPPRARRSADYRIDFGAKQTVYVS